MRKSLPVLFFALALICGFTVASKSWNGAIFVYLGEQRAPASVRSIRDYSMVDRSVLYKSVSQQMLNAATVEKRDGFVGVNLGHPLFQREAGSGGDFACPVQGRPGMYDHVELTWLGVGISSSGEQPTMAVRAACLPGRTLSELATIWIPMSDIIESPARDQELQGSGDNPVVVSLAAIPGEWPEQWVLQSVRFYNAEGEDEEAYTIGAKALREYAPPLIFDYK